jgi:glycosyltransferase involved in cell wall biosynthesis
VTETGRLPITAIVVSRNEAPLLAHCLPTIRFCDEVVVVDLQSQDATAEVARANGATVVSRPAVPSVERVRAGIVELARNDWLLFTDPDEELPPALAAQIEELLETVDPEVAVVYGPIQYYFGTRPLRGTVWGGIKERRLLVRRSGVDISPTIYSGAVPRDGFRTSSLPFTGDNAIVHHWVDGYRDFLVKHRRYVSVAAEDRCRNGEVTGVKTILATPWRSFAESFATRKGYRDGPRGLALSALWAWYSTSSEVALERRRRAVGAG